MAARGLDRLLEAAQQQLREIKEAEPLDEEQPEIPPSPVLNRLVEAKQVEAWTHFTEESIQDLYQRVQTKVVAARRRGPAPKISYLDAVVLLLMYYNTYPDFADLANAEDLKENTLRETIDRIRPYVHSALTESWWETRRRPRSLSDTNFPHIALLVDSSSFPILRPRGAHDDVKPFFDGKNKIYAYKKEIAVMAKSPYYALFSSPRFVGSKHDYQYFKNNYTRYEQYLLKSPEERLLMPDDDNRYWSVCADKGYIGPAADTGDIRKITPKRNPRTNDQKEENKEISRIRVHVERFFGRLTSLWRISRDPYKLDHSTFDTDIDNCILLTNEHIKDHDLNEEDQKFYERLAALRVKKYKEQQDQKRQSNENYRRAKRMRLLRALDRA